MSSGDPIPIEFAWAAGARAPVVATPVSLGVDLPVGRVRDSRGAAVVAPGGERFCAQGTALGHWPDGSVRWLLVDCVLPAGLALAGAWQVVLGTDDSAGERMGLEETAARVRLRVRDWSLTVEKRTGAWQVAASRPLAEGKLPGIVDQHGREHIAEVKRVSVTSQGPIRGAVEVEGVFRRLRGLRVVCRWSVFAGTDLLQGEIMLHNPRRAIHRGGLWDLGDAGSVLFRDFSQKVSVCGEGPLPKVDFRVGPDEPVQSAEGRFELYQESSGGEHWNSLNHLNRQGEIPLRLRGFRGSVSGKPIGGMRAQPVVKLGDKSVAITAEVEDFWQQFPKAIEIEGRDVSLRLFPKQFADLHELQGGEQKSHRCLLRISNLAQGDIAREVSERLELPTIVQARSLSPRAVPGMPELRAADPSVISQLDQLTEELLAGPRGIYANRELVDEYGWRNWGDLHADHEELHYHGEPPLVSHYNNQFDVLLGFLLQYLRTGDERWMQLARPLARHVIDIDIYHTTEDRPAYSGGLFWFTDHYLHARTSTHRTYSRDNAPASGNYGGGPSACHNFTTGLLLYHLLTGDPAARAAVISLADWVLAQDDGARTILGLVDDGPTGMASATSSALDHRPGRGAGNSINALLDAWLLTHDNSYLNLAESLIHRCVHPKQDIDALNLLHAEKHWSYTVFLVSLSKYLQCKEEACQFDAHYAYGRDSLVHYGQWMLANERPYLDRAEELEYPTEAWAAQEFRKANALRLAARYCEQVHAAQMLRRGHELALRAWKDLFSFERRTTIRAMAVVMVEGLRDAELRRYSPGGDVPCSGLGQHPPGQTFLPQRERVKRRLRSPAGIASLLVRAANPARWHRILNHR
jgi:hypothetical protein